MKVELKVKKQSSVVVMGHCPQVFESQCGINYRQS